jgi:hypothetical protein
MYFNMGIMAVNYLDDFGGAEVPDRAIEAYRTLEELLLSCGLDESKEKSVEPTTKMILPGRTQAEIKWSLPSKDCNSFKEDFFFLNQDSTNNEISKILSAETSKANFS